MMEMRDFAEEMKERDIVSAKTMLTRIRAAKILAANNDLACEIHIAGVVVGLSDNSTIIPVLEKEADEIRKFIAGKSNKYE